MADEALCIRVCNLLLDAILDLREVLTEEQKAEMNWRSTWEAGRLLGTFRPEQSDGDA